jgi:hypothetical protein
MKWRFIYNSLILLALAVAGNAQTQPIQSDSIHTVYFDNGRKLCVTQYEFGKKDGFEVWYYESGAKKCISHYRNGKKDGMEVWFYEDGKKKGDIPYRRGKKEGNEYCWDESGKLVYRRLWENDVEIKMSMEPVMINRSTFKIPKEKIPGQRLAPPEYDDTHKPRFE